MRWFALQRRLFAALSITVLAGGMALLSGSAASAAPTNAINFGLSMVARLEIGVPPVPPNARVGATLAALVPVSATVDSDGNIQTSSPISLGSTDVPIDRQADSLLDPPLDQVRLFADDGFRGTVDLATGAVDLHGNVKFTFAGKESGHDYECTTEPSDLHLLSSGLDGSGSITLSSSPDFALGVILPGNDECDAHDGYFNSIYPLPTPPNGAVFNATVSFSPALSPGTTIGSTSTPTAAPSSGGSAGGGGGAPVGAAGKVAFSVGSLRRTSPKTAAPKSTKAGTASGKTTTAGNTTTPTTAYVWKGGSGDVTAGQFDDQVTPPGAVAARPPILPQESTAKIATDTGNRYGLGILVLVLGAAVAAVLLLRSEARRFFRRRDRAAF